MKHSPGSRQGRSARWKRPSVVVGSSDRRLVGPPSHCRTPIPPPNASLFSWAWLRIPRAATRRIRRLRRRSHPHCAPTSIAMLLKALQAHSVLPPSLTNPTMRLGGTGRPGQYTRSCQQRSTLGPWPGVVGAHSATRDVREIGLTWELRGGRRGSGPVAAGGRA